MEARGTCNGSNGNKDSSVFKKLPDNIKHVKLNTAKCKLELLFRNMKIAKKAKKVGNPKSSLRVNHLNMFFSSYSWQISHFSPKMVSNDPQWNSTSNGTPLLGRFSILTEKTWKTFQHGCHGCQHGVQNFFLETQWCWVSKWSASKVGSRISC